MSTLDRFYPNGKPENKTKGLSKEKIFENAKRRANEDMQKIQQGKVGNLKLNVLKHAS